MRFYQIVLMLGFMGISMSCSFLQFEEVIDDEEKYRLALIAYEKQDFDTTMRHLRNIRPNSQSYLKSLKMIKNIPYARVQAAFKVKDYKGTVIHVNKIPPTDPNYNKAQDFKAKALYQTVLFEYEIADTTEERTIALKHLTDVAIETNDRMNLLLTIEMIGDDISRVSEPKKAEPLIVLLGLTIEAQNDIDVLDASLRKVIGAYGQFSGNQVLRIKMLQLIANAKYKMN